MRSRNNNIEKLTPELMERYRKGDLSDREMHAVERLMLDSAFEAEAMEGMESVDPGEFSADLDVLGKRLGRRVSPATRRLPVYWMAAAVVLLAITAGVLLFNTFTDPATSNQIAMEAATDSLSSDAARPDATDTASDKRALNEPLAESSGETPDEVPEVRPSERIALMDEAKETREEAESDLDIEEPESSEEMAEIISGQGEPLPARSPQISAVPRVDSDSSPVALPDAHIAEEQKGLVGIIKGDEVEIITPMPSRPLEHLHGRVIDKLGKPVPYARLKVSETNQAVMANQEGEFELNLEDENDNRLIVSLIGLKAQDISISSPDSLFIVLDEDSAALSTVTLEQTKAENNVIYRGAGPAGGEPAYERYLDKNIRFPVGVDADQAELIVIFTVNPDGGLTDFRVRKSPDTRFSLEAMRLVKEGPAWKPALEDGRPVRDRVRLLIRFEK